MSTINEPNDLPDTNEDCIALRKAFDDIGCDKKALMDVICHRNQQQRSKIRSMYGSKYEEDLLHRLRSKLHGDLEKAVLHWMRDPAERDAVIINDALKGWNKDQVTLTEVLYLRTSSQLVDIRRAYTSAFSRSLEEDIGIKTSGDEKKLLLAFVRQDRQCDLEPDMSISQADAKDLLSAVAVRNAVDKTKIIRIFSTRSPLQLKATIDYYKESYGHSIGKVIKQEINGAFQGSLRVAMKCAKNPINYFAKALYTSMKGLGTDDSTLIRIVVTRAEMDMKDIKAHFARKYRRSLQEMISSDTSGHYRTFLLLLIGTNPLEIQSGSFSSRFSSRR